MTNSVDLDLWQEFYHACWNCGAAQTERPAPVFCHRCSEKSKDKWRVGRSLGRTLYLNDKCIGMVDTPELAELIVSRMNENES